MAQVFVSYKREDLKAVQPLVKALKEEGIEVWWDQDIPPDAAWEETIEREHHAAKAVIVAWSRVAVKSENVKAEARRARNEGRLLQIFVEPCDPPMFFGERQGLDFTGWDGKRADRRFITLLAAVQALNAGKPPPAGVGFARRRRSWMAVSGSVLGALAVAIGILSGWRGARDTVCAIPSVNRTCLAMHWVDPPPPDPATSETLAKGKLIAGLNGRWDGEHGDCRLPTVIAASIGPDGVARIRVSRGSSFTSQGQITNAADGVVTSRDIAVQPGAARQVWEYRPAGDEMTVLDPDGHSTSLVRCTDAAATQ